MSSSADKVGFLKVKVIDRFPCNPNSVGRCNGIFQPPSRGSIVFQILKVKEKLDNVAAEQRDLGGNVVLFLCQTFLQEELLDFLGICTQLDLSDVVRGEGPDGRLR